MNSGSSRCAGEWRRKGSSGSNVAEKLYSYVVVDDTLNGFSLATGGTLKSGVFTVVVYDTSNVS